MRPIESFDEVAPGQEWALGSLVMTEADILRFAGEFDPQPFHLDPAAGRASIFGGLIASGLHTQAACFALVIRSGLLAKVSMGGPGMNVTWPAPVYPGDEIAVSFRIETARASQSKPDRGIVQHCIAGTRTRDGVVVLEIHGTMLMKR